MRRTMGTITPVAKAEDKASPRGFQHNNPEFCFCSILIELASIGKQGSTLELLSEWIFIGSGLIAELVLGLLIVAFWRRI
jgi:hypothetical protein